MENEKQEKVNIIDDERLQNKFVIILKEGNPYSSPELEKYAWQKYVDRIENGEEEISSLENDVKRVVEFCVNIKKEYYAQHNIETDIDGNPNVKKTLLENPELVKESVEFARIVEESVVTQKIDYKNLSIFELETLITNSSIEDRIEIFSNYFNNIYTNEVTEQMIKSFSEIFSNKRLNKIYNSPDIKELNNEEREAIKKFIGEKGKDLNDDELLKILREKMASVYMIKSFEKNKFEIGNVAKEDLPKIYKALSYLSKAEEGTEERKVFEASILGIVGKNISIEDALEQIEIIFEGIDPNFHENLKNEHKISEDFKNIEQDIKNADKDQFFEEAKKVSDQYVKEKYERIHNFSDKQRLMYDRISSINVVPTKSNAIQYTRNAKIIVRMYEELNSKKTPTDKENDLKEVLEYYIKLQENRAIFAPYITVKNDHEIIGIKEDSKEDEIHTNGNIINENFIQNLIKNLEDADQFEKKGIEKSTGQDNLNEETNLCVKINWLNKDVIPEELFSRYTILKEKLAQFPEGNFFEKNMLNKELSVLEVSILENVSIIKQYYKEIGKEDYIDKIFASKNNQTVINYDAINKEKYIVKTETSQIYDLCIEIAKLTDRRRFGDEKYNIEIESKKEQLQKLIDSSDNKEKYKDLFFEKIAGKEQLSERKIIKDVDRLTNLLMGYNAVDEISNDIKYGKEFSLLSTEGKTQYLKNIIILMNNKENKTLSDFTNLVVERISRTGVELRDNTGNISEEKILKFYNSFVAENQKIKSIEGVFVGRNLKREYKALETYNMKYDIEKISSEYNEYVNSVIKDEENISERDASYVVEAKETLSKKQLKINNVLEKIDLNDESDKETIINLYWIAKNKALSDIRKRKENPNYVVDEKNYRFYKDLGEVIKLDSNRIGFSEYLKGNHIITPTDRDIVNSEDFSGIERVTIDGKERAERIKEKISPYKDIIASFYQENENDFEKALMEKLDIERNAKGKNEKTQETIEDSEKKEREILETLKEYKELAKVEDKEKQQLSGKELYKIEERKKRLEKKIAIDPAYQNFCNKSRENKFDLKKIEEEIIALEKKLNPIKDSEINLENIVELNATAVEKNKADRKVEETKISDSEIEKNEFKQINASAIDAEKAKDEESSTSNNNSEEKKNIEENVSEKAETIVSHSDNTQEKISDDDSKKDKEEQEDEEKLETTEEVSEENESKNNLFTNITKSVKAFINRVTVPKLTDGTENGIGEEKKEGFFTSLFNKAKVNKIVHEEKNTTDENKVEKEENSVFGRITINTEEAIKAMKKDEGVVKSGEENGER